MQSQRRLEGILRWRKLVRIQSAFFALIASEGSGKNLSKPFPLRCLMKFMVDMVKHEMLGLPALHAIKKGVQEHA